jgi:nucleoside-diphosphate-sugar epimerase
MSSSNDHSENPLAEDLDHILRHTEGLWEPLRNGSIFITGGTGFFGRWLLESFAHANRELSLGAKATVLSRNPGTFRATAPHLGIDAGIALVEGDVRDFTAAKIDAQLPAPWPRRHGFFIHAATEASAKLNAENPLLMVDTIVAGTRAALDFAVATGVRRFLLTSSGAVYGRQPSEITHVPEDYAGAPDCTQTSSAYGEGKRMAELLCACYAQQHGLECLIARCFAFVGPFLPLDAHFAIGNFIRDALRGGPIQVSGDGTPYRSYLYAADLAIWLWTIVFRGKTMHPYNVGSDQDLSISRLAVDVGAIRRPFAEVTLAQQPSAGQQRQSYVPSVLRAASELGLKPIVPLPEAIRRTIAFAS